MTNGPRRHRRTSLTAFALLPLAALAACGGGGGDSDTSAAEGSGKGTISVWAHQGQASETAALQNAVKTFNSSQSAVKAELKLIPENDYTKTITATDPSELPDVLEFDGPTMANFVYNSKLAPLDDHVSAKTLGNATDAIKAQGEIDGKHYGLGMFDSGLGLYADKKQLDAAGVKYPSGLDDAWTAEEFGKVLKALRAKDSDGKVLDISEQYGLATEWGTYGFSPIVWSAGGALLKDGKAEGALDKSELYKEGGPLQLFADQLARPCGDSDIDSSCVAVTRPVSAGYPTVTAKFNTALNSIYGGADPQEALRKAARAIDRDFTDNAGYEIP